MNLEKLSVHSWLRATVRKASTKLKTVSQMNYEPPLMRVAPSATKATKVTPSHPKARRVAPELPVKRVRPSKLEYFFPDMLYN